jgi:thiol-disulfide isomerase/thioredoxin
VRRLLAVSLSIVVGVVMVSGGLLIWNRAPAVAPVSSGDLTMARPVVVKIHARWCPVCMTTKSAWDEIQSAYQNDVHFVVFDVTSDATKATSRLDAERLGLNSIFDEYQDATGTVLVLDATTRTVSHDLYGHRAAVDYRTAIDAALDGR